ncbi:MAG: hypothetical protein WBM90_12640 [Acidimicrobiia bacterium]
MQSVKTLRHLGRGLGVAILVAVSLANLATFEAAAPGEKLEPIGGAGDVINLIQGQQAILWTSLSGTVNTYRAVGWESSDGTHDLGGALVIEDTNGALAGVVNIGEKPKALTFDLNN